MKAGVPCRSYRVVTTHIGIGDSLMVLCAVAGLKRDHPHEPVEYMVHSHQMLWVALFGGYDVLGANPEFGQNAHYPCSGDYYARPQWWHLSLALDCGTTPVLPPVKPLCREALDWARQFAGYVVVAPNASDPARRWPGFFPLVQQLTARGYPLVVLAGAEQRDDGLGLPQALGESPQRVAALLARSALLIGNDSGMTHLAGCLGVPAVATCMQYPGRDVYGIYPTVHALDAGAATPAAVAEAADVICRRRQLLLGKNDGFTWTEKV